jgi:hypothetical protein
LVFGPRRYAERRCLCHDRPVVWVSTLDSFAFCPSEALPNVRVNILSADRKGLGIGSLGVSDAIFDFKERNSAVHRQHFLARRLPEHGVIQNSVTRSCARATASLACAQRARSHCHREQGLNTAPPLLRDLAKLHAANLSVLRKSCGSLGFPRRTRRFLRTCSGSQKARTNSSSVCFFGATVSQRSPGAAMSRKSMPLIDSSGSVVFQRTPKRMSMVI